MDYERVERSARALGYRDKLRLAQQLIQLARREEEQAHFSSGVDAASNTGDGNRMARIRTRFPRAYERWSSEEDDELRRLHEAGWDETDLADRFGRQPSAIRSRIEKLEDRAVR